MDIKSVFTKKNLPTILGVVGVGLFVLMGRSGQNSNEESVNLEGVLAEQSEQNRQVAQQEMALLVGQFNQTIEEQASSYKSMLEQQDEKISNVVDSLSKSFNQSTKEVYSKLSSVESGYSSLSQSYNNLVQEKKESEKVRIFAGGADYDIAKDKYGKLDNVEIIYSTDKNLSSSDFKKGDIVLGGTGAIGGVKVDEGNATRLAGKDRYETANQLDQVLKGRV